MKRFRKSIMVFMVAAILAVTVVTVAPKTKKAFAIEWGNMVIVPALQIVQQYILDQISEGITSLADNFSTMLLDRLMPFFKNQIIELAREQTLSKIEQTRQIGQIEQVEVTENAIRKGEVTRYQDIKDAQISVSECKIATAANLHSASETDSKAYAAVLRETLRQEQNHVKDSLSSHGPVITQSVLLEERFENFCSKDEQKGNLEEACQNTDPNRVDKDKTILNVIGEGQTIPKEDFDATLQALRYMIPPPKVNPLPRSLMQSSYYEGNVSDPAVTQAYIQRTKEQAKFNAHEDWLIEQVSRHMEPQKCPKVFGSDHTSLDFVNTIDTRLGIPLREDRPCPSEAEMERYMNEKMLTDPMAMPECQKGNMQIKRCNVLLQSLKAKMNYDIAESAEKESLMMVADRGSKKPTINTPIGAVGQDNSGPVSGNTYPGDNDGNVFDNGGLNQCELTDIGEHASYNEGYILRAGYDGQYQGQPLYQDAWISFDSYELDPNNPPGYIFPAVGETITLHYGSPNALSCTLGIYGQNREDSNGDGKLDSWLPVEVIASYNPRSRNENGGINEAYSFTLQKRYEDVNINLKCDHQCFPEQYDISDIYFMFRAPHTGYEDLAWWDHYDMCHDYDPNTYASDIYYNNGDGYFYQGGTIDAFELLSQNELQISNYQEHPQNPEGWSFPHVGENIAVDWNFPTEFSHCVVTASGTYPVDTTGNGVFDTTYTEELLNTAMHIPQGSAAFVTQRLYTDLIIRAKCKHTCNSSSGYDVWTEWRPHPNMGINTLDAWWD